MGEFLTLVTRKMGKKELENKTTKLVFEEIFTISGRKFGKSEENSTACFVKGFDKKGIGLKCEIILELMIIIEGMWMNVQN